MATELVRKNMIEAYRQFRLADMFLSSFFVVRNGNISNTEKVSLDIVRGDEQISPIVNTCEGPTFNVAKQFTTKEFTPPSIEEAMPFNCKELLNRLPGTDEYSAADVGFQAQLFTLILEGMNTLEEKIRRNREYQASQILQTGELTLQDENGNDAYTIDYFPKATHFVNAATTWDNASADPFLDIENLADVIRDDSLGDADMVIMGQLAWNAFINNPIVQAQADNRRMFLGNIDPDSSPRGRGGKFMGTWNIGSYNFQIWTFNGRGIVPGSVTKTRFVTPENVIVMTSDARLDTVFAAVPMPVDVDPRFSSVLPGRVAVPRGVDMAPNIYATPNGREVIIEVVSRPLLIPTAIDSFGRIVAIF